MSRHSVVARRQYSHCAKCGTDKAPSARYVGPCCVGTPGLYSHCAVGGEALRQDSSDPGSPLYVGRCYVCEEHLARR